MPINPKTSPAAAKQWTGAFFRWIAFQEQEAAKWYETLVEQIAMGVVSCDQIIRYNQHQERLYYWEAWAWNTFDAFFNELRGQGLHIPIDPSLPRLIGTVYKVGGGKRLDTKFEVSVPCSPQGMADVRFLDIRGMPENCYRPQETPGADPMPPVWTGHMLDLSSGTLAGELGGWPVVALAAVIVVGIAVAGHYWSSTADNAIGIVSDATLAKINAEMENKRIEVDRKRAEMITACVRESLVNFPNGPTLEERANIYKLCEDHAKVAFPDRAAPFVPYGGLGKVLLILGLAGAAVGTVYLVTQVATTRRREPKAA